MFLAKARGIRPTELETLVVVKSLLSKEENVFFNFRQEMEMYSKLDHANVVKLLGMCREMEPQFLITEYCDWVGTSLSLAGVLYFLHTHLSPSTATGWVPACHWLEFCTSCIHTSLSTATGWVPACHWLEFCTSCIHTSPSTATGWVPACHWLEFCTSCIHTSPSTATGWVPACHWLEFCTSCIHTSLSTATGWVPACHWLDLVLYFLHTHITEYCD